MKKKKGILRARFEILIFRKLIKKEKGKSKKEKYEKKIRLREKYIKKRMKLLIPKAIVAISLGSAIVGLANNAYKQISGKTGNVLMLNEGENKFKNEDKQLWGFNQAVIDKMINEDEDENEYKIEIGLETEVEKTSGVENLDNETLTTDVEDIESIEDEKQEEEQVVAYHEENSFKQLLKVNQGDIDETRQNQYIYKFEVGSEERQEEMLIVRDLDDGVLTVGLGHTEPIGGKYQEGDKITMEQVYQYYHQDLQNSYNELEKVEERLGITDLKPHQRFALVSHIYNTGTQNVDGIEKYLTEYKNGNEEGMWENIRDFVLANESTTFLEGLSIRRIAEHLLFIAETEEEIIRAYKICKEEIAREYVSKYYTIEDVERYGSKAIESKEELRLFLEKVTANEKIEIASNEIER